MKILLTVLAVLAVLVGGLLVFAYGGFATVAATQPHSDLVEWYLVTARESAIHSNLDGIQVPALDDPAKLRTGVVHYQEMCVMCHGAPGIEPTEIAQGLNPMPPELYHGEGVRELTSDEAEEESREEAAEAYWVIKHGIRMTGMPAFGPTRGDEEIWALVALVQRLPDLSADEYAQMVRNAGLSLETGHSHGEGGHGEGSHGGEHGEGMDDHGEGMDDPAMDDHGGDDHGGDDHGGGAEDDGAGHHHDEGTAP